MAILISEIAEYLEDQGHGTVGKDIYLGKFNDTRDNQVMVRDTGGLEPDAHLPLYQRTVQIMIRNKSYTTGETLARAIRDDLHNRFWTDVVTGGTNFQLRSSALQEPASLGQDGKKRYEWTCNFLFLTR